MTAGGTTSDLDIRPILAGRGIPFTRQRRDVWRYFVDSERASTIPEVAADLAHRGIGQATVYRTVTLLTELGLLHRVQDKSGEVCFTAIRPGHRHPLICGVCRRVVDFTGEDDLADLQKRLEAETGFSIYGHHVEIYGICPECAASGRAEAEADWEPAPIGRITTA